jgi:hypothetical protein
MPEAGWYGDPQDSQQLRYWDGARWGETKPRSRLVGAGTKMQATGDGIANVGKSIMWIVVGLVVLFAIFLIL